MDDHKPHLAADERRCHTAPVCRRSLLTILWRGLRKKCPRCGRGAQFESWFTLHNCCSECDLQFERNSGDTWGFWIIGDRVIIAILIAIIFFRLSPDTWQAKTLLLTTTIATMILTMPHRQGVCTALDYYIRRMIGEDE
jgi:uncharacterized protein (DUF983 family)